MHRNRLKLATVFAAFLLLCAASGLAQQGFHQQSMVCMGAPNSAQGNLTVTATVVASVGLVTGPDGEQRIIVANAADPHDNVSGLQTMRTVALVSTNSPALNNAPTKKKKH